VFFVPMFFYVQAPLSAAPGERKVELSREGGGGGGGGIASPLCLVWPSLSA